MGGRGASGSGGASRMAKLEGSEKQIKWANDLRTRANKVMDEGFKEAKKTLKMTKEQESVIKNNLKEAKSIINQEKSSSRIIRYFSGFDFYGINKVSTFGETMRQAQRMKKRMFEQYE